MRRLDHSHHHSKALNTIVESSYLHHKKFEVKEKEDRRLKGGKTVKINIGVREDGKGLNRIKSVYDTQDIREARSRKNNNERFHQSGLEIRTCATTTTQNIQNSHNNKSNIPKNYDQKAPKRL